MNQVNMYPKWHEQSIEIQQQFNKSIAELKDGTSEAAEIEEESTSRERSKLRDRLYNRTGILQVQKNPLRAWSEMEADAFGLCVKDRKMTAETGKSTVAFRRK